jgi:UDP-N-acetylglucosamine 2-epimerase
VKVLVVLGTRPEAVKLAPVVLELSSFSGVEVSVLHTRQHTSMADSVLEWFGITPRLEFSPFDHGGSLNRLLGHLLTSFGEIFESFLPDWIVVQGDTTSALAGALAGFHSRVPIAHIEAGLRTHDLTRPFPEEANRVLISRLAERHYCPTGNSAQNLISEGIDPSCVRVTGNTVVDAFQFTLKKLGLDRDHSESTRHVLVTAHRRESWGSGIDEIFSAVAELAGHFPSHLFTLPVHLNPIVRASAERILSTYSNVGVTEPLSYPDLVALLNKSTLVITDSGGLQEEAVSAGIPTLVTRTETDRPEGIAEGILQLVGTTRNVIVDRGSDVLRRSTELRRPSSQVYGDGKAATRIAADLFEV